MISIDIPGCLGGLPSDRGGEDVRSGCMDLLRRDINQDLGLHLGDGKTALCISLWKYIYTGWWF